MFSLLHRMDLRVLYLINSDWSHPFLDWLMARVTDFGLWKWPLVAVAAATLIWGGYRARLLVVLAVVAVLAGEGINGIIKHAVDRPRPYQHLANIRHVDRNGVQISTPGPVEKGRSMPSSHVTNNAVFAFLACAIFGRWGRLVWIGVVLVAYSRIYVGSHYPSDTIVAVVLALGCGTTTIWAAQRAWRLLGPKWFAKYYDQNPNLIPSRAGLIPSAPEKSET
jgi:undecaprenyl-diphosphatase